MLLLFICCMICHNELYRLRPHPRFLPSFYLMIALGGAIGGIFVNLLAPYLFTTGFWELQWGVVACGVLLAIVIQVERTAARRKRSGKARQRGGTPPRWNLKPDQSRCHSNRGIGGRLFFLPQGFTRRNSSGPR